MREEEQIKETNLILNGYNKRVYLQLHLQPLHNKITQEILKILPISINLALVHILINKTNKKRISSLFFLMDHTGQKNRMCIQPNPAVGSKYHYMH